MGNSNIKNKLEAFQKISVKAQKNVSIPQLKNVNTTTNDNLSRSLRSRKEVTAFIKELKQIKK